MAVESKRKRGEVQPLDFAVVAASDDFEGLRRAKAMTPCQRRAAERQAERSKVTYEWPPALVERINEIARANDCPANQVAAVLAWAGMADMESGAIDLEARKYGARSLRFLWFLDLSDMESASKTLAGNKAGPETGNDPGSEQAS